MESNSPGDKEDIESGNVCKNVARLLEVSAGQIELAKCDGAKAFHKLSALSTEIFRDIALLLDEIGEESPELKERLGDIAKKTDSALGYFQFFDLMNQRIDHGVHSVSQLSDYLRGKDIKVADECWLNFRDSISDHFSLEQEKELFELMMSGMPREQAVQEMQKRRENSSSLSVEFF